MKHNKGVDARQGEGAAGGKDKRDQGGPKTRMKSKTVATRGSKRIRRAAGHLQDQAPASISEEQDNPLPDMRVTRAAKLAGRRATANASKVGRNRSSPARLWKLNEAITSSQKAYVYKNHGGGLLNVPETMPIELSQWLIKCYHPETSELVIPERGRIPINAASVHSNFGLPNSGRKVPYVLDRAYIEWINKEYEIEKGTAPDFPAWCDIIKKMGGSCNEKFLRAYYIVAVGTFLWPTTSINISPRCYACFKELELLGNTNICQFVVDQTVEAFMKMGEEKLSVNCCVYNLVISYLDSLAHNLKISNCPIRVMAFDPKLISKLIKMDMKSTHVFGKLQLKDQFRIRSHDSPPRNIIGNSVELQNFVASKLPSTYCAAKKRKLSDLVQVLCSNITKEISIFVEGVGKLDFEEGEPSKQATMHRTKRSRTEDSESGDSDEDSEGDKESDNYVSDNDSEDEDEDDVNDNEDDDEDSSKDNTEAPGDTFDGEQDEEEQESQDAKGGSSDDNSKEDDNNDVDGKRNTEESKVVDDVSGSGGSDCTGLGHTTPDSDDNRTVRSLTEKMRQNKGNDKQVVSETAKTSNIVSLVDLVSFSPNKKKQFPVLSVPEIVDQHSTDLLQAIVANEIEKQSPATVMIQDLPPNLPDQKLMQDAQGTHIGIANPVVPFKKNLRLADIKNIVPKEPPQVATSDTRLADSKTNALKEPPQVATTDTRLVNSSHNVTNKPAMFATTDTRNPPTHAPIATHCSTVPSATAGSDNSVKTPLSCMGKKKSDGVVASEQSENPITPALRAPHGYTASPSTAGNSTWSTPACAIISPATATSPSVFATAPDPSGNCSANVPVVKKLQHEATSLHPPATTAPSAATSTHTAATSDRIGARKPSFLPAPSCRSQSRTLATKENCPPPRKSTPVTIDLTKDDVAKQRFAKCVSPLPGQTILRSNSAEMCTNSQKFKGTSTNQMGRTIDYLGLDIPIFDIGSEQSPHVIWDNTPANERASGEASRAPAILFDGSRPVSARPYIAPDPPSFDLGFDDSPPVMWDNTTQTKGQDLGFFDGWSDEMAAETCAFLDEFEARRKNAAAITAEQPSNFKTPIRKETSNSGPSGDCTSSADMEHSKSPFIDYDSKRTFACSAEVNRIYNAVLTLGRRSSRSKEEDNTPHIIMYNNFFISLADLASSMKPAAMLTDTVFEVVVEYLNLTMPKTAKKLIMPLRITTRLQNFVTDSADIASRFHRRNRLDKKDMITFPVLETLNPGAAVPSNHYRLLNMNLVEKRFEVMDSLRTLSSSPGLKKTANIIICALRSIWDDNYPVSDVNLTPFGLIDIEVPKQNNTHDCGIYSLMNAQLWRGKLIPNYGPYHIPNIRKLLTVNWVKSDSNNIHWQKVLKLD